LNLDQIDLCGKNCPYRYLFPLALIGLTGWYCDETQYSKGFRRIFSENILVKKGWFFSIKYVFSLA